MREALLVAAGFLLSELLRRVLRRWGTGLQKKMRERGVHVDAFKYGGKRLIKEEIQNDLRLNQYLLTRPEQRHKVDEYLDEIVPNFNLLSYYKLGFNVAKLGVNFLYTPLIDRRSVRPGTRDDVVIYMANHRSNMDYVLVAYMLAQNIAVSYAVGEWARVFPLEYLFKSFGSYFVRRGEKDPLYHLVLEIYVQLISRRAVSQGIFPEGGLSRDGKLRDPKVGLLDAIARITLDAKFRGDVYFVPVGINYDHVLEDRVLTAERTRAEKPTALKKLFSLLRALWQIPVTLAVNVVRTMLGRLRRHGYAAVSFGAPISLTDFLAEHGGRDALRRPREERKPMLEALARRILGEIGEAIPVTPVPLLAKVLLEANVASLPITELESRVAVERRRLREKGRRIVMGSEFEAEANTRAEIAREVDERDRRRELVAFEEQLVDTDEANRTLRLALDLMQRRKLLRVRKGVVLTDVAQKQLLEYYAASIVES